MERYQRSTIFFSLIAIVSFCFVATMFFMWRITVSIQDQTAQKYELFQKDLFQKSAFTNKSIMSLFKLRYYEPGNGTFEVDVNNLKSLSKAIVGHQKIAMHINENIVVMLPEDDPLFLKEQFNIMQPGLQGISQMVEGFFILLNSIENEESLRILLITYRPNFEIAIVSLNEYLNVQTKVQSVFFSSIQSGLSSTIENLNALYYFIALLAILILGLFLVFFTDKRKAQRVLAASYALLENRVAERTSDLKVINKHLEQEVSERKAMEGQLRLKSDALENSLNGFDIIDDDGLFVYANRAYLDMWGYNSLEEIIGTSPAAHCKDPDTPKQILDELKNSGKTIIEFTARRKDGTYFEVLMYARLARDENGREIYPTTSIDITARKSAERERKKLEKQLLHSRKMEAIGTLSGGIAHEFNNIISIILGNAEFAAEDTPAESPVRENLIEIRNASLRGKNVVRQLLSFSRDSMQTREVLDVAELAGEALNLLRASIPSNIKVIDDIAEDCHDIVGDSTQFNQIIINLCTNSSHAMEEEGGTLMLHLYNSALDDKAHFIDQVLDPGAYVVLSIEDSGHGIPEALLGRIFDPFFTTKEVDKGSGMGLAVVHGIVAAHQGGLRIKSSEETGTSVEIFFPALSEKRKPTVPGPKIIPRGNEHIIFIDDEDFIARLGKKRLERLGYTVSAFTDPLTAITEFEKSPELYDLIITDMTMPSITGDQLIVNLRKIKAQQKTIISTGYSKKMDSSIAEQSGIDGFIMKPFSSEELAVTVRNVLDK